MRRLLRRCSKSRGRSARSGHAAEPGGRFLADAGFGIAGRGGYAAAEPEWRLEVRVLRKLVGADLGRAVGRLVEGAGLARSGACATVPAGAVLRAVRVGAARTPVDVVRFPCGTAARRSSSNSRSGPQSGRSAGHRGLAGTPEPVGTRPSQLTLKLVLAAVREAADHVVTPVVARDEEGQVLPQELESCWAGARRSCPHWERGRFPPPSQKAGFTGPTGVESGGRPARCPLSGSRRPPR